MLGPSGRSIDVAVRGRVGACIDAASIRGLACGGRPREAGSRATTLGGGLPAAKAPPTAWARGLH